MFSFKRLVIAAVMLGALVLPLMSVGADDDKKGPRKFYLTKNLHNGSGALSACAEGYHMASLWEILDPSHLRYDTELGFTYEDSGSGPPSAGGWIRTGNFSNAQDTPGFGNCNAWTSARSTDSGSWVGLPAGFWNNTPTKITPWSTVVGQCNYFERVWCVQD